MVSPSSPHMTLEEFEKTAHALFLEYFENGDTQEVCDSLDELNIKNFKPEVSCSCQNLPAPTVPLVMCIWQLYELPNYLYL